jgi:hypothetical protein
MQRVAWLLIAEPKRAWVVVVVPLLNDLVRPTIWIRPANVRLRVKNGLLVHLFPLKVMNTNRATPSLRIAGLVSLRLQSIETAPSLTP